MMSIMKKNSAKPQQTFKLSSQNIGLFWFCQLINVLSLSAEISLWMLILLTICFVSQIIGFITSSHSVNRFNVSPILLRFIAVSGCLAIVFTARFDGILICMIHLLSFSYILKMFEMHHRKDFYQWALLGLFLLASALIFEQNLGFYLFIIASLLLNLLVVLQVFTPQKKRLESLKTAAILIAQSALLAIVLFIFFPRISPFWQVPNPKSAQTGLSEQVMPGDIAHLALSNDLAFRVDFKGEKTPPYDQLYWRAMTLENFDGKTWSRVTTNAKTHNSVKTSNGSPLFNPKTTGKPLTYDVTVERSFQSWLFGLAVAKSKDLELRLLDDYTIKNRNILVNTRQYTVTSYLQAPRDLSLSEPQKQRNLAIIKGSNPQLEQFGLSLLAQYDDPEQRSAAVLTLFRQQPYFYTLQPPLLTNNSLDQFFFETKAGYCEHYASAYTYLMRAAGVPARIVTGYLGGEYNHVNNATNSLQGGHLSIYQYDAHAWAEIWLAGRGWQRIDPTVAVAPQRVEHGWSSSLLKQKSLLSNNLLGLYQFKNIPWLNTLRLHFDALDYQWTKFVLGYSAKHQADLLTYLLGAKQHWKAAVIIAVVFFIISIGFYLIYRVKFKQEEPVKTPFEIKLYQQVLAKLAKKGFSKNRDISPTIFAKSIAKKYPEIATEFSDFTLNFERLRYQNLNVLLREKRQETFKNQVIILKKYFAKVK